MPLELHKKCQSAKSLPASRLHPQNSPGMSAFDTDYVRSRPPAGRRKLLNLNMPPGQERELIEITDENIGGLYSLIDVAMAKSFPMKNCRKKTFKAHWFNLFTC
jgi:hypothetical protein